jgi:hypothetical protein
MNNPGALLVRIQERMGAGTLPCEDCVVTWYGPGRGLPCAVCDRPLRGTPDEIECDVHGGGTIYFHRACHTLWQSALAA